MTEISQELKELLTARQAGLIGDIEARNGLEHILPWFADARDSDIDEHLRRLAEVENELDLARGDGEQVDSDKPYPDEQGE